MLFASWAMTATGGKANPYKADCLSAFDAARHLIHDVARQACSHGRRNAYTLKAGDFRLWDAQGVTSLTA